MSEHAAENDAGDWTVQEGIRCSHGVQGPYASAGEPIANCGERGTVVSRLLYHGTEATEWSPIPPAEGGDR